ncbi:MULTISPECIES: DUF2514 domain-containing protein [unclassified Pseudomonas]|uniref:DUF2514 domain-containing protein n=1 Tax=unclassified Pseudomonas TaxID=196821 RepID=UPI001CBC6E5D|nr:MULTISPECIES: DUF2514 domain-containing protein [unclassified Pseudomonas]
MTPIWPRVLPYITALALMGGALFGTYHHGLSVKDAEWQAEWDKRDTRDAQAKNDNETAERAKEQARQQSINKAIQDGQQIIDRATADADVARASAGSLQLEVDKLASRLTASQGGGHSCTAAASQAATRAVLVLANVFKRADQRAGDLAGYADQSRGRGVTCEQAFDGLSSGN